MQKEIDLGLGTTYERFAVYRWLDSVATRYPVHEVLEGPGDGVAGIAGIHSIPLAQHGAQVTVALSESWQLDPARRAWQAQGLADRVQLRHVEGSALPFPDAAFDLVWNFNRLPFLEPDALVAEMARLSRRYVMMIVPNRSNYGFPARRLYHRRTKEPWPYGDRAVMSPKAVRRLLAKEGLRVIEWTWVDVPWWPDIIDPRAWLRRMLPFLSPDERAPAETEGRGYCWRPEALPYFDAEGYADLHRRMSRLSFIERWPGPRWPFAHHFALLAEKR